MAKRKTVEEGAVTRAAVSIGTALGKAAAQFDSWLEQRDAVARELTAVIGKAQVMLSSIGTSGRPAASKSTTRTRKTAKTAKPARKAKGTGTARTSRRKPGAARKAKRR